MSDNELFAVLPVMIEDSKSLSLEAEWQPPI